MFRPAGNTRSLANSRSAGAIQPAPRPEARKTRSRLFAVLALACALDTGIAAARGTPRGQFGAWAIGLPDGYVMMEYQAPVIQVTADDVARGVIEVRGGTRLVISSRSPTRYAVDFFTRGALFQPVEIEGLGNAVELGPTGGTVVQQQAAPGRRVVTLNYRFVLAPGTAPGTYAWPLDLAVRRAVMGDLERLARDHRNVTAYASPRNWSPVANHQSRF